MNKLARALKLPPELLQRMRVFEDAALAPLVLHNELSLTAAVELLRVTNVSQRTALMNQAIEEHWDCCQTRAAVRRACSARPHAGRHGATASAQDQDRKVASLSRELDRLLDGRSLSELPLEVRRELMALHQRLAVLIVSEIGTGSASASTSRGRAS